MKSYVFYDDTADYEAYDDVRAFLFDTYGEDNGWATADDVPDNWIYDEISEQNNADWQELLHDLGRVFKEDCYLLTGTCGRWCGPRTGWEVHQQHRRSADLYPPPRQSEALRGKRSFLHRRLPSRRLGSLRAEAADQDGL